MEVLSAVMIILTMEDMEILPQVERAAKVVMKIVLTDNLIFYLPITIAGTLAIAIFADNYEFLCSKMP